MESMLVDDDRTLVKNINGCENETITGTTPKSRRKRTPLGNVTNRQPALENVNQPLQDPVTPTANFKLLTSLAASLEYADSPNQKPLNRKLDLSHQNPTENSSLDGENDLPSEIEKIICSRKEKSLGLLCQRFLSSYPDFPPPNQKITIGLDEAAKDLGVERRRIYDIVNVLESVEVVSKVGKNTYSWHGKGNLTFTLAKFMVLAEEERLGERLRILQEQMHHEENRDSYPFEEGFPIPEEDSQSSFTGSESRKEKSLAIISQKFLMLFLVSETKTINLDLAARAINGVQLEERAKKTKTRRLYDIANILQSLGLIQKVFICKSRGRKPAFQYSGPQLPFGPQKTNNSAIKNGESKVKKLKAEDYLKNISENFYDKRLKFPRTKSENIFSCDGNGSRTSVKRKSSSLVRHSSLQEICEIAERERKKLYPEGGGTNSSEDSTDFENIGLESLSEKDSLVLQEKTPLNVNVIPPVTDITKCQLCLIPTDFTYGVPIINWAMAPKFFIQNSYRPIVPIQSESQQTAISSTIISNECQNSSQKRNDDTKSNVNPVLCNPNIIHLAILDPPSKGNLSQMSTPRKHHVPSRNDSTTASPGTFPPPNWKGILDSPLGTLSPFSPIFSPSRLFYLPTLSPVQTNSSLPTQTVELKPVQVKPVTQEKRLVVRKLTMTK